MNSTTNSTTNTTQQFTITLPTTVTNGRGQVSEISELDVKQALAHYFTGLKTRDITVES